uniref:EFHB C-terminal EF-hand domain-containing protein n=1 Tax=Culex tarsalis TaxID=7177 RepID=A0A1Q3G024_CULTA
MAPSRSIRHRPADKMAQLLAQSHPESPNSNYQATFLASPSETYLSAQKGRITIDYSTQVKPLLELNPDPAKRSLLDRLRDKIDAACHQRKGRFPGQQRELGTVRDLGATRRATHGIVTSSEEGGMRSVLFPGGEEEEVENVVDVELERLKGKVHGAVTKADPTGGRTLNALRYERCDGGKMEEAVVKKVTRKVEERVGKAQRKPSNLIVNQDINEEFLKGQEALGYLRAVRSRLVKRNKEAVDTCRKHVAKPSDLNGAVDLLRTTSGVPIQATKLEPLFRMLNIGVEHMDRFWDLFDHQVQLSTFKIGSFIKPFEDLCQPEELSRPKDDKHKHYQEALQARLKLQKFKDFDTAADLISPKPGTPFGLSHVDYFLPRTKEEIKTIFRNFDLSEPSFEDAWRMARRQETCTMNKVSAENFKQVLHEKNIRLTVGCK